MPLRHGQNWNRQEVLIAFNLYCRIPFRKISINNPEVQKLAVLLGRTPGSLAKKMFNLAHHDPENMNIGIQGLAHGSREDKQVWDAFHKAPTAVLAQSQVLLERLGKQKPGVIMEPEIIWRIKDRETARIIRSNSRVGQHLFRQIVLANYHNTCCITGIPIPELLNASHIKPWAEHKDQRLNPANGLALNALHDRAFDRGFITVNPDGYRIEVSDELGEHLSDPEKLDFINRYNGKPIDKPSRFPPDKDLLDYHHSTIFEHWR